MNRFCLFLLILDLGCNTQESGVALSAAASTREPIEQLARQFQSDTKISVQVNFGPSSTLAKQIQEGGPSEIFLSADEGWADYLAESTVTRRDLLGNRLAVIVPADSSLKLTSLGDVTRAAIHHLALAGPAVPAGKYAREALRRAGILEGVKDRIVSGNDVRGALAFVEHGEADAGIVYQTDAAVAARVRMALLVPAALHQPIRYPLVLLKPARAEARRLYDFLASAHAAALFRKAGFETLTRDGSP